MMHDSVFTSHIEVLTHLVRASGLRMHIVHVLHPAPIKGVSIFSYKASEDRRKNYAKKINLVLNDSLHPPRKNALMQRNNI